MWHRITRRSLAIGGNGQSVWWSGMTRWMTTEIRGSISSPRFPTPLETILTLNLDELEKKIQGRGRAESVWGHLREGVDPITGVLSSSSKLEPLSSKAKFTLQQANFALKGIDPKPDLSSMDGILTTTISHKSVASCGTRKLLIRLQDGLEVEAVLIPNTNTDGDMDGIGQITSTNENQDSTAPKLILQTAAKPRTTLCVSTQVGCDRACKFCLTGRMGFIRNLSASEILEQVIHAIAEAKAHNLPSLTNIVFMGMGDAGRNISAVSTAVHSLTDDQLLRFGPTKVTVSTVGPSPEVFSALAALPSSLAWSLHSPVDSIRRRLVPSTRHTTIELRNGLIEALLSQRTTAKRRSILIACTLLAGVNDTVADAEQLAEFIQPIRAVAKKVVIDLIPYNDVAVDGLARPSEAAVQQFYHTLRQLGVQCSIRLTRGEDESAACGMLATKRPSRRTSADNSPI